MNWKRVLISGCALAGVGWVVSKIPRDVEYEYEVPDEPIEVEVDSDFECREEGCSDSFDSEHGRDVHEGRMH